MDVRHLAMMALAGGVLAAACASSSAERQGDADSGAGASGGAGTRDGGGAPESGTPPEYEGGARACVPGSVWKPTSARLRLQSSGFWQGIVGYEKSASGLTDAQVTALTNLCLVAPSMEQVVDGASYRITIEDRDGTFAMYRAAEYDARDQGVPGAIPTISFASLAPFLATFDCLTSSGRGPEALVDSGVPAVDADSGLALVDAGSSDVDAGSPLDADTPDVGADAPPAMGLPDPSQMPVLSPDPGCLNGIRVGHSFLRVPVARPGTLTLAVEQCSRDTALHLFSPQQASVAESEFFTAPNCATLTARIHTAGNYIVELQSRLHGDASYAIFEEAYLRVSLTP